jgi:hypothetical protein
LALLLAVLLQGGSRSTVLAVGAGVREEAGPERFCTDFAKCDGCRGVRVVEDVYAFHAIGLLPADLLQDVAEGVGLLQVDQGFLDMAHLGAHVSEEAGDLALCVLGKTDIVVVGVNSSNEGGVFEGVEGVLDPGKEWLVLTEQAALEGRVGACLKRWLDGRGAKEAAV